MISLKRLPAMLVLATLAACSTDMGDLEVRVAAIKSQKSRSIEPIPQIKQYEAFAYDPADRQDPFAPAQIKRTSTGFDSNGIKPDLNRNKEPLEEYPLDSLRMLGIIESQGRTYALVKSPDGVVHRVAVKDHLGQNYGEITAITESEVSIMEIIPDNFGGWMQRAVSLALTQ